ncbi:uncharacterized protein LOC116169104 [Photinus pyralis]|uniref:uncharacterized protein LOC116169104 n=1 Tax=Photinus pyralis TaxID=7054 RepID=UPI00126771F3|nr:uncharacterized protein LOC116169104 [Photinus pyralis]
MEAKNQESQTVVEAQPFSPESQDLFGSYEMPQPSHGGGETSHQEVQPGAAPGELNRSLGEPITTMQPQTTSGPGEILRLTNMIEMIIQQLGEGQRKMGEGQQKMEMKVDAVQQQIGEGQHRMEAIRQELRSTQAQWEKKIQTDYNQLREETQVGIKENKLEIQATRAEMEYSQKKAYEKWDEKLEMHTTRTTSKFEEQEEIIQDIQAKHGNFKERVKDAIVEIEGSMKKNEERIDHQDEEIGIIKANLEARPAKETNSHPAIIYKADHLLHQKPKKFDGNIWTIHPVSFLEGLENYLRHFDKKDETKLSYAKEMVEGNAKAWADLNRNNWKTWEEFKDAFIKNYWSEEVQGKIRLQIATPRLYQAKFGKYTDHVWFWVNKTNHLQPPMRESQLVDALSRHFPREVEHILIGSAVNTVKQLINTLERIQTSNQKTRPRYNGPNRSQENTREEPERQEQRRQVNYIRGGYNNFNNYRRGRGNYGPNRNFETSRRSLEQTSLLTSVHNYFQRLRKKPTNTTNEKQIQDNKITSIGTIKHQERNYEEEKLNNFIEDFKQIQPEEEDEENILNNNEQQNLSDDEKEEEPILMNQIKENYQDDENFLSDQEEEAEIIDDGQPIIIGKLEGVEQQLLLDTGSQVSVVSEEVFEFIQRKNPRVITLPVSGITIQGITGKIVKVVNQALLTLQIQDSTHEQKFLVVKKLETTAILGTDWMRDKKAKIDMDRDEVYFQDNDVDYYIRFQGRSLKIRTANLQVNQPTGSREENEAIEELISQYEDIFSTKPGLVKTKKNQPAITIGKVKKKKEDKKLKNILKNIKTEQDEDEKCSWIKKEIEEKVL